MAFPGGHAGIPGAAGQQQNAGMSEQDARMVKIMQSGMESCLVKSMMAGGAGFALGGVFGLFMASMNYDTPMTPQGRELTSLPMREQLRRGFKDMGSRSWSSAKNFGKIGFLFSICECTIEGFRAKNDLYNSAGAGGMAGAILARNAGPQAMLLGGGGFALFSTGIDWYMRSESDD
ncbi:Mitochondrial import inner membrane translocase subunit tim22 [Exophiala xenobiotica]|uniref:Mitochondrial import inner membrane translocase subunit TIM22 n=1 Tax=Lithohypha guttulata TaxID=1690604 RepID=A0ABR0KC09_9EURO|nr:Mitochondrial import inner membrane translocase subunit tim22 [Lithohypha guttulata]KAK5319376.1 Mitochondrial import inner membrane translocase subunit tim22 [Exophiala xenobiotica]